MSKKLILALAATLAVAGPALADGNDRNSGQGWLLNPGPIASAPAARTLAPVASAQARVRSARPAGQTRIRTAGPAARDSMHPWGGSYGAYRDMLRFSM